MKVLLILVDGMRPDSLTDIPQAQKMIQESSYSMKAETVFPSVTLPCHMSLFHSVNPERHGTTTNTYMPQVRTINGLCEQLHQNSKTCAFFYNWEELRDLSRPSSLVFSCLHSGSFEGYETSNHNVTDAAIQYITEYSPDFAFLYLGLVDEVGHKNGWMGKEYMEAVKDSWEDISRIMEQLNEEWSVIITADHGGHDRTHGTTLAEDMTIPVILHGSVFEKGKELENVNIKDIAPTIAALLDTAPAKEWEGKCLI